MLFSLAVEPTHIISPVGCLLILRPHLNYFLFSVNSRKSDYWSLQVAKCDIITNIYWGFSTPERPPLCIPIVISLVSLELEAEVSKGKRSSLYC